MSPESPLGLLGAFQPAPPLSSIASRALCDVRHTQKRRLSGCEALLAGSIELFPSRLVNLGERLGVQNALLVFAPRG
jgi:hypothetical protein